MMTIHDDVPPPPMPPDGFFERFEQEPPEPTNVRPLRALDGDRIEIKIGPDVHRVTDEIATALKDDPELYRRAGVLAHVVRTTADDEGKVAPKGTVPGSPIIRAVPLSWLVNRASRLASFKKRFRAEDGSFAFVSAPPPKDQVRAVLEAGEWKGVRELRGILEAPALRPDGTIIQTPGYDRATGFLYEPNAEFPPIPDAPTRSDAVLAFRRLIEPFTQFPYVSPAHLSSVVAAILTLLARPAIYGAVPCWVFDASAPRSGKSLQVDVIHLIATGRPASRMTYPTDDAELEKVLAGYAMRGSATVNFDNIGRKFGGDALDKVITAIDEVDLRVLGSSDMRTFAWRAVVFASGNNVEFRGDMLPRVLCPRLETPLENPERRDDLAHPDLRAYVTEHRVELVVAALTLLRAYVAAGAPDQGCPRWGGFEAWSRLIPHALVWLDAHDPMGARRGLEGDEDPERVAIAALVVGWSRLVKELERGNGGVTLKEALTHLYPKQRGEGPPDGYDELREAIEGLTDTKPNTTPASERLGKVLRRVKARPIAGMRVSTATSNGKVMRWTVRPA